MPNAKLENEALWEKFNGLGNEMIVNNKGRRLFPIIKANLENLESNELYSLYISFIRRGSKKFVNGQWLSNDRNNMNDDEDELTELYMHPDSPNYGKHWNENSVDFFKLKVTNKRDHPKNQVYLDTFYHYVPRLTIFKIGQQHEREFVSSYDFEKASFVAVTTYQNEEVKNLKVTHNKYAKGQKRKFQNDDEDSNAKSICIENANLNVADTTESTKGNSYEQFLNPKIGRHYSDTILNGGNMQYQIPQADSAFEEPFWRSSGPLYSGHFTGPNFAYSPIFGVTYGGSQNYGVTGLESYPNSYNESNQQLPSTSQTQATGPPFLSTNLSQGRNGDYTLRELQNFQNTYPHYH